MMWVRDLAVQNIYIWSLYFGITGFYFIQTLQRNFVEQQNDVLLVLGFFSLPNLQRFAAQQVTNSVHCGGKRTGFLSSLNVKKLLPAVPETMLIINIFYYPYLNKNEKQTASHCQLCRQNFFFKDAIKKPVEFPLIGKISLQLIKNVP